MREVVQEWDAYNLDHREGTVTIYGSSLWQWELVAKVEWRARSHGEKRAKHHLHLGLISAGRICMAIPFFFFFFFKILFIYS